tara:strand:- start:20 stop:1087 length:1068 start_codon:yes stop_codon:yes gene_type:complete
MKNYVINSGHVKLFKLKKDFEEIKYGKKEKLMEVKCEIDKIPSKKWERAKKKVNKYEYIYTSSRRNRNICDILPVSRSYFKIYEILKDIIKIENEGVAGCIAEGPGGFIHCINDTTNIDVHGITLISKTDRNIPFWNQQIINNKKNILCYGTDKTGDIYKLENTDEFISSFGGNLCNLVTADGGFDYSSDYNSQESDSYRLLFSEIYIALNIQKKGGSFLIKFFDIFNYKTIQLIYILFICYQKINIFKPITSRLSNSEKYIVCEGFNGCNIDIINAMQKKYDGNITIDVPDTFIKEILEYNDIFVEKQIETIREIISNTEINGDIKPTKEQIKNAMEWCLKYELPVNESCIYKY